MRVSWRREHRLFAVASVLTLIAAILHTTGIANDPYNDEWAAAVDAMQEAAS